MKISKEDYKSLAAILDRFPGEATTVRGRWDHLWRCLDDLQKHDPEVWSATRKMMYGEYNDEHIDTALRHYFREKAAKV